MRPAGLRWCTSIGTRWGTACGSCPPGYSISREDTQRAAARELLEEAGIEAGTWRVLVDAAASPGFTDEVVRVFLATGLSHPGRGESHDEEADMTVHWVPLSKRCRW